MHLIMSFFLFGSRKMSQDKKNQDFGNIFSFPSYSQKTDDGKHIFNCYEILGSLVLYTNFTP